MNDVLYDDMKTTHTFNVDYTYIENQLKLENIDLRSVGDQYDGHVAEVLLFPGEDLLTDRLKCINLNKMIYIV